MTVERFTNSFFKVSAAVSRFRPIGEGDLLVSSRNIQMGFIIFFIVGSVVCGRFVVFRMFSFPSGPFVILKEQIIEVLLIYSFLSIFL